MLLVLKFLLNSSLLIFYQSLIIVVKFYWPKAIVSVEVYILAWGLCSGYCQFGTYPELVIYMIVAVV